MNSDINYGLISKYRSIIMGVACLLVMLSHYPYPVSSNPFNYFVTYGNVGVDIFLFVSGISLYFSFYKDNDLRKFYKKRIVRILIPFLILAIPFWGIKDLICNRGNFLLDITMISFFTDGVVTTWYVIAILSFYLLYPLIFKLFYGNSENTLLNSTKVIILSSFIAILCLMIRKIIPIFYENVEIALTRSIIFVIGCYFGKIVFEKKNISINTILLCLLYFGFYLFVFRKMITLNAFWIRMSYIPLAFSIVVLFVVLLEKVSKIARLENINQFISYFGNRSFEIYLSHVLLLNLLRTADIIPIVENHLFLDYIMIMLVSILIAEFVHQLAKVISEKIQLLTT